MNTDERIEEIEKDMKILISMIGQVQSTMIYMKNILDGEEIKNIEKNINYKY